MHFILPYFIIILIVIQLYLKKSTRSGSERSKKYWEREQKANSTRKQDISSLNYIKWDDALPAIDNSLTLADILNNSPEALKAYNNIQTLKTEPMLWQFSKALLLITLTPSGSTTSTMSSLLANNSSGRQVKSLISISLYVLLYNVTLILLLFIIFPSHSTLLSIAKRQCSLSI